MKKQQIREEIRCIVRPHKPNIVFLTETMVPKNLTQQLISTFGFEHYDYVNPVNYSGGMWVPWNNTNVLASVMIKEHRLIHTLVLNVKTQQMVTLSNIYAPIKNSKKSGF